MKKKITSPKTSIGQQMVDDAVSQISQLLHIQLPTTKLIILRDTIISKRIRNWDKKSFIGKALRFHHQLANLGKVGNVNYLHLLMAELIRNFSIATKEEYLVKCEEFRIYPFQDKIISNNELNQSNLTVSEVIDVMKKAFEKMEEDIINSKNDEIDNANNQDYPICSFEDLLGKSGLN
jgi:hypothetical protein